MKNLTYKSIVVVLVLVAVIGAVLGQNQSPQGIAPEKGECHSLKTDSELAEKTYKLQCEAQAFAKQKRYKEAIQLMNTALSLSASDRALLSYRGYLWSELHKFDRALADLTKAISLDQNDPYMYLQRGSIYMQNHQYESAIRDFNIGSKLRPDLVYFNLNLANAYVKKGKLQEAQSQLDRCIEADPFYVDAFLLRAQILKDAGNVAGARNVLEQFLALAKEHDFAIGHPSIDKVQKKLRECELLNSQVNFITDQITSFYEADNGIVSFSGSKLNRAALAKLKNSKTVYSLGLVAADVTDSDLANVVGMTNLKQLCLTGTRISDTGLKNIRSLKSLRTLYLDSCVYIGDDGIENLKNLTNLEELYLRGTRVTSQGIRYLKNLRKLRVLDVASTKIGDHEFKNFQHLTSLQHLLLGHTQVSDVSMPLLVNLKALQGLNLANTSITVKSAPMIAQLSNLRRFNAPFEGHSDEWWCAVKGLQKLLQVGGTKDFSDAGLLCLQEMTQLKLLSLTYTQVTDSGLSHLRKMKHLTELQMSSTVITDIGLYNLNHLTGLQKLCIHDPKITGVGLIALNGLKKLTYLHVAPSISPAGIEAVSHLSRLQKLSLRDNHKLISCSELVCLTRLPKLTELDLSDSKLSYFGIEKLGEFRNLKVLNISGTKFTLDELHTIRQLLPDCLVISGLLELPNKQ